MKTETTTERLAEAASRVLAMHDDQMFICGCNDEGIVSNNLKSLRAALAAHEARPSIEREAIEALRDCATTLEALSRHYVGEGSREIDRCFATASAVLAKAERKGE